MYQGYHHRLHLQSPQYSSGHNAVVTFLVVLSERARKAIGISSWCRRWYRGRAGLFAHDGIQRGGCVRNNLLGFCLSIKLLLTFMSVRLLLIVCCGLLYCFVEIRNYWTTCCSFWDMIKGKASICSSLIWKGFDVTNRCRT